jgi:hypothetical protein
MHNAGGELPRIPLLRTPVNKLGIRSRFIGNSSPPASMDGRSNPAEVAREKEVAHEAYRAGAT